MAALARQSTAFRDVFNQWLCSGLAVLSVRSSYPPLSCCRDLHADLHKVTTIPDQGKHCLEMSGLCFFCTFFAGLDNRLLVPKKKKNHPFPQGPDSTGLLSDEYERVTSLSGPFGHCESSEECGGLCGNSEFS